MTANNQTMHDERRLTLGPVLFNWAAEDWRDFYFRIADEAPVDVVYVGEVVCSKRQPFFEPYLPDVIERLEKAGKRVVLSALAVVMNAREVMSMRTLCGDDSGYLVEANDISQIRHLKGRPFAVGPFVNVYNEGTARYLAGLGAEHICLPPELPATAIRDLARGCEGTGLAFEVQVYGRLPLAVSARCYHARAHGLAKDNCQFVCEKDPDGMVLDTLEDAPFLAVNGIQTMSYTCCNLADELDVLAGYGVTRYRLSPHSHNMVRVAEIFRNVIDHKTEIAKAMKDLEEATPTNLPFANGFYNATEGHRFVG